MASDRLKTLATRSVCTRIAGGFAVLLALLVAVAAATFQLMGPVDSGAGRVRRDSAKAEIAGTLLLKVSDARASVAQYALTASVADQKAAKDSLAQLGKAIGRTVATSGRDEDGLTALAVRYRTSVDKTFSAVELRRAGIESLLAADTEIRMITSAIAEAMERETDADLIRSGMRLAQSFQESDAAAVRFLASRSPADSNIAARALTALPAELGEMARLARDNPRIRRFVGALKQPLDVYTEALQRVVAADGLLRRAAVERDVASAAVLKSATAELDEAAGSQRDAVASMLASIGFVHRLLLAISLIAIAIGLALAVLIGRALLAQFHALEATQAALSKKSILLETTLANMDQGLVMVTAERTIGVVNDRALHLLDLPSQLMRGGAPFGSVVRYQREHGEFAEQVDSDMWSPRQRRGPKDLDPMHEWRRPNGTVLEIRSVTLPDGGVVQTFTDITERKLAEERVIYAAQHDVLTRLPNRALFARQLETAMFLAERDGTGLAVLFLDLDRFKLVNDTLGHSSGDELLLQLADRMRNVIREEDTLARMGGDEFALVMPSLCAPDAAIVTAERMLTVVREPYWLAQGTACIGVSIGISFFPTQGRSAEALLNHADLALYRAKTTGRDRYCVFDEALDSGRHDERILENSLQFALQAEQFILEYQPIWDMESGTNDRCRSVGSLAPPDERHHLPCQLHPTGRAHRLDRRAWTLGDGDRLP